MKKYDPARFYNLNSYIKVLDVLDVTYKLIVYIAKAELCFLEIIYTETLRDFWRKTDSLLAVSSVFSCTAYTN